jgi:hypothetical protein
LGVSLDGLGGKTPIAGAPGRGVHRRSTSELEGIVQPLRCTSRRHGIRLRLLDPHR